MSTILLLRLPPPFLLLSRSTVGQPLFNKSKLDPVLFGRLRKCLLSRPSIISGKLPSATLSWTRAITTARIQPRGLSFRNGQLRFYSWRGGLPEKSNQQSNTAVSPPERLLDRLKAKGQLSNLEAPPPMSNFQRLFPSFLFTLGVCIATYAYSQYWTAPKRHERLFPELPQAAVTVGAIVAINTAIWLLWKVPIPLNWRILNSYFISVPGLPNAPSMLGCVFSHQSFIHLALNSIVLYTVGTSLCDEIGRGNFLALYISSGVISSFASLTYHVLLRRFHVFSLGASGAVSGVVGTYVYFNPNSKWFFIFFPFITFKAAHLAGILAGLEIWGIMRGYTKIDHVAHLTGLATGFGYGMWLWSSEMKKREARRKKRVSASSSSGGSGRSGGNGIMGWFGW